ncbi:hypothetical protein [Kribbella flavida]|uniref:hypothetical protein n=1 Tax=Kribbella flavida TaxID=182640 RepID=UPI0011D20E43|nr:hypothetical protein [Kribbella flavida]
MAETPAPERPYVIVVVEPTPRGHVSPAYDDRAAHRDLARRTTRCGQRARDDPATGVPAYRRTGVPAYRRTGVPAYRRQPRTPGVYQA